MTNDDILRSNERIDQLYSSDIKIIQSDDTLSFSLDAVLLANFVKSNLSEKLKVLDLCSGNGAVGLFLSSKIKGSIYLLELQNKLSDMSYRSIKLNHLTDRYHVINDDLKNISKHLNNDSLDLVVCNPPYFINHDNSTKNQNDNLTLARHEVSTNLSEVLKVSSQVLKMRGKLVLVHRPERLTEIFTEMLKNRLVPKRMQFIHSHHGDDANMILIEAIKDGKTSGLKIIPPIIVYKNGEYTPAVRRILYGNSKR